MSYLFHLFCRLKKKEGIPIIGYGYTSRKLTIHVDVKQAGKDHDARVATEDKIKHAMKENDPDDDPTIEFVSFVPSSLAAGKALYVSRPNPNSGIGTIGAFVSLGNHTAALTCKHVVKQEENALQVKNGPQKSTFGSVIHMSDKYDFAVILVDNTIREHVSFAIKHGNKTVSSSLKTNSDGRPPLRNGEEVFKRGAITGQTRGTVIIFPYTLSDWPVELANKAVLVESIDEENNFTEGGDSGSIVYRMNNEDPNDENIELIAMHAGELIPEDEHGLIPKKKGELIPKKEPKQCVSFLLEGALEEANNAINLEFK